MTLLPELERELLRVARRPPQPGERSEPAVQAIGGGHSSVTAAFAAIVAVAALAFAGLLVVLLHRSPSVQSSASGRTHAATVNRSQAGAAALARARGGYPGAPRTQPGNWGDQSGPCPLAARNPYLPKGAGCVTVRYADVGGAGHPDLVLLYGHPGRRQPDGFTPSVFTLAVVRTPVPARSGAPTRSELAVTVPAQEHPTIILIRNVNDRRGAEILVHETHISSGEFVGVYTFDGRRVERAGAFTYGGDSGQQYGFTCHGGNPATIVQHQFLLEGPNISGRWRRTDTTYAWVGARLVRIAKRTTSQNGFPPKSLTGVHC